MNRYKSIRINKGYEKSFEKLQKLSDKKQISLNQLINEAIKEYTGRRNEH